MQLEVIKWIQRIASPFWDLAAQAVTTLGETYILAGLFCTVYWCWDKRLGRNLVIALCGSLCVSGLVKDLVKAPRPFDEEGIFSLRIHTATGHSFPSGHTQTTTVFWITLALWKGKKRWWALAAALILLVGLSRLYLGVHYPADVLGGICFGILVAVAFYLLLRGGHRGAVILVCLVLGALALVLGESENTMSAFAMMLGLGGGLWFEARFVRFRTEGLAIKTRILRLLAGVCVLGILFLAGKLLLPEGLFWKCLRYGLVVFAGLGPCPLLFQKLKLNA